MFSDIDTSWETASARLAADVLGSSAPILCCCCLRRCGSVDGTLVYSFFLFFLFFFPGVVTFADAAEARSCCRAAFRAAISALFRTKKASLSSKRCEYALYNKFDRSLLESTG
jgi:hypothetical protein